MNDDFTMTLDRALSQVRSREDAVSLAQTLMRLANNLLNRTFDEREDEDKKDWNDRREHWDGERECGSHFSFM